MVGFFADYIEINLVITVFLTRELVNYNCYAVRNFVVEFQKNFFAHYFGDHKSFAFVRNNVLFYNLAALGHLLREVLLKLAHIGVFARRNGENVAVNAVIVQLFNVLCNALLRHNVYLCVGKRHRNFAVRILFDKRYILVGNSAVPVVNEKNKINVLCGVVRGFKH